MIERDDDDRLDAAIRSALGAFAAAAPRRGDVPMAGGGRHRQGSSWARLAAVAAVVIALAGILGLWAATRPTELETGVAPSAASTPAPPATPVSPTAAPTAGAPTVVAPSTSTPSTSPPSTVNITNPTRYDAATLDRGYDDYVANATACGAAATIPAGATVVQTIEADVDGDGSPDTVTLYLAGSDWHLHVVASANGLPSDTVVRVLVQETMALDVIDLDRALGAESPPPVQIVAVGRGANEGGITSNFTVLSLTPEGCVLQWRYRDGVFQWATVVEPGHYTGVVFEGAPGQRHTSLVDALQDDDGSWTVETQLLTHDATTAILERRADEEVADFLRWYGDRENLPLDGSGLAG